MNTQLKALKSDIQVEIAAIERIFEAVTPQNTPLDDVKEAIVAGYYLHNLYNAFENIFKLVAAAFENDIPDASQRHSLLLDRMGRNIEGIRPRLLSNESLECLDELRRFRHLFRHLYRYDLKVEGVQKALVQAYRLRELYQDDLERFIMFLDRLTADEV